MPRYWFQLFILIMAHPHSPYYSTTASAQSDAMSLISLAPPTSIATSVATPSVAAAAATTSSPTGTATILYPSSTPTINSGDTVLVSYDTPWQDAALTVYCEVDGATLEYKVLDVPSSGTYTLSGVQKGLGLVKYPASCHLSLAGPDSGDVLNGGAFSVVSTAGAAKTYSATGTAIAAATKGVTSILSSSATTAGLGLTHTSVSPSHSSSDTSSTNAYPNAAAAATSSSTSSESTSNPHFDPSVGAKVGIVISVFLIVFLALLAAFLYRRQQRKIRAINAELSGVREQHASEKAYLDSILTVAGKPDTEHGGKIVRENGVRQSGDWRRFFGSKAASAAGSIAGVAAAVGAAVSKPGSRRASLAASRPGTAKAESVPDVPNFRSSGLPPSISPSDMGESRSTTGLIAPASAKQ